MIQPWQPCQPKENPALPDYFYSDVHSISNRFRIGPPQVSLNLLPPEFHRQGILLTFAIMKEKQQNNLFEIECMLETIWKQRLSEMRNNLNFLG